MSELVPAERRAALQAYLEHCRDQLRLDDWDLEVRDTVAESDCVLEVVPQPAIHWASVRVGSFFTLPQLDQRQAVAHELFHLVQGQLLWWVHERQEAWGLPLAPDARRLIEETVTFHLETHASWAARVIEPLLPPLPAWP